MTPIDKSNLGSKERQENETALPGLKKSWMENLLDLVFPPFCVSCKKRLSSADRPSYLCISCKKKLQQVGWYCPFCEYHGLSKTICYCGHSSRLSFYGLYWYQEGWKKIIIDFKYYQKPQLAVPLGRMLAASFLYSNGYPEGAVVTYIPLHSSRQKDRGYNQSFLLAREFSRALELPLRKTLERTKYTWPQTSLSRKARRENVRNCFSPLEKGLEGINYLLVDDVLTTGATLEAATQTLKNAGGKRVTGVLAGIQPHYSV